MMFSTLCRKSTLHLAALCMCFSCSSGDSGEQTDSGNGPRPPEDPVVYVNANLVYYGYTDDVTISNEYELSFYTDMSLDQAGNPVGPGKLLRLSVNGELFEDGETDFSLPAGTYQAAASSNDFTPGTFSDGFMWQIDLPTGKVEIPKGSFFGDVPAGTADFEADLLEGGSFTVVREGAIFTVSGTVVGAKCLKRKFIYTGNLPVIDRSNNPEETPNSNLTAAVDFVPAKARLQDKGDNYYLKDESLRVLEIYLGSLDLNLTPQWPEGSGQSLKVDLFVPWATDVAQGIPAGTYAMVPQTETGGIERQYLVPGGIAPGFPDRFTYPDGSWYHVLTAGTMTGYARIVSGTMTVVRNGDAHQISFDFVDCDTKTPHHIRGSYAQQTPIPVYKFSVNN